MGQHQWNPIEVEVDGTTHAGEYRTDGEAVTVRWSEGGIATAELLARSPEGVACDLLREIVVRRTNAQTLDMHYPPRT